MTMTKQRKIKADQWYKLVDIQRNELFRPFAISLWGIKKIVEADKRSKNLLKASVLGRDRNTRYFIKGKNLIKFLAHWEDGSYRL